MSRRHRLAMIARLTETWARRPSSPTRLVVDITRRCNLRCEMCKTWARPRTDELTAAELEALFAQLPRLTWLDITGGEPFVRGDIEQVLTAALVTPPALGMFHFQTNGWSPARIEAVTRRVRSRRDDVDVVVTVSIDGPPAVHDRIRGRDGSAARALETLERLQTIEGIEVHVGTTVSDSNVEHLAELETHLHTAGHNLRRWHWNWLQTSGHFFDNEEMAPTRVAPGSLLRRHLQRRGIPRTLVELMEAVYLVNLEAVEAGAPSRIPCQALRSAAFVSPEGDLFPCHIYDRPLGNVRDQSFASVWNHGDTLTARRDIEALACGGCFSACEAYPALAGAPLRTVAVTTARLLKRLREPSA